MSTAQDRLNEKTKEQEDRNAKQREQDEKRAAQGLVRNREYLDTNPIKDEHGKDSYRNNFVNEIDRLKIKASKGSTITVQDLDGLESHFQEVCKNSKGTYDKSPADDKRLTGERAPVITK